MTEDRWMVCLKTKAKISKIFCFNQRKRQAATCRKCPKGAEKRTGSGAKLVTLVCVDCGTPFEATYQKGRPARRCPVCRAKHISRAVKATWAERLNKPILGRRKRKRPTGEVEVPCGLIIKAGYGVRCRAMDACESYLAVCLTAAVDNGWRGFKAVKG